MQKLKPLPGRPVLPRMVFSTLTVDSRDVVDKFRLSWVVVYDVYLHACAHACDLMISVEPLTGLSNLPGFSSFGKSKAPPPMPEKSESAPPPMATLSPGDQEAAVKGVSDSIESVRFSVATHLRIIITCHSPSTTPQQSMLDVM